MMYTAFYILIGLVVFQGQKGESSGAPLAWRPIYCVPLVGIEGGDLAALQFSFSFRDAFKTEFFASSFDGEVAYADWVRPESEEHPEYTKLIRASHCGPVKSLQRSPFFDDVLLSVGDWTFQVWREGHDKPLFMSPYAHHYYIAGMNVLMHLWRYRHVRLICPCS